ncbi:ABC transporter ATP-binding protein [Streptomyces phaeochromogenes]|uniref:ATP-binding cassette domain-containing protein n=1 Tax=Streptomyces phaeochromogenes TaxID=1923 RepID=A0ABZ1HAC0_STRPH|nr:ATP-binding cassette domain-containing protein [Streptomyces phaeochromogenes]WSD14134.1 ATP-binding cassette domain-containing protein [Streptomyces phaeochromogenes]WSJ08926.1 ATP-binding cassette domain-containing protein [Streptomyces phaeochromogenes]
MNRELLLEGVGRRYGLGGAPWVLRGVDLALAPGTLTRIEGANGTGKSTLLRLLAGIDAPTEGRITGRPRTAYVPERFPAALPFTAAGYLIHLGSVHGLSRGEAARAAVEWLERLGAAEYARTPMSELSKGSSQKVAVAQALLAEPELLVLDEAWTGLDTAARTELERAVLERRAAGGTVVFVDHDPRRLAGAPDVTYAVVDGNVRTVTVSSVPREEAYVVVEVQGAPGAEPPVEATRLAVSVEEPRPGRPGPGLGSLRLTVPETHSDTLLRTLLTAHPPWHVVSVGEGPPATRVPPRAPAATAVDAVAVAVAGAGADVDAEVRS